MKHINISLKSVAAAALAVIAVQWISNYVEDRAMHVMPKGLEKFNVYDPSFGCGRWKDHMPKVRNSEVYRVYIAARKQWRSKIEWQLTRSEAQKILDDVKFAADSGDWGARALMSHFYREGLGPLSTNNVLESDPDKAVAISRMAVEAGQPWGFYDLGVAHEYGYGGAALDNDIAWAYFLKAARLGSPDAQMALAQAYEESRQFDKQDAMLNCALIQGHGAAAYKLGLLEEIRNHDARAIGLYQEGVKFGSKDCASSLYLLFIKGNWGGENDGNSAALDAIGIVADQDRAKRYRELEDALAINPDLRFTRLDERLPLPPAPLPEWRTIDDMLEPESDAAPRY
jgi:TPR repeat protein